MRGLPAVLVIAVGMIAGCAEENISDAPVMTALDEMESLTEDPIDAGAGAAPIDTSKNVPQSGIYEAEFETTVGSFTVKSIANGSTTR